MNDSSGHTHLLGRISPIFSPFSPVFCAFSPSRRGGSNEPQAGTQGQETADRRAKRGELPLRSTPQTPTKGSTGHGLGSPRNTPACWPWMLACTACLYPRCCRGSRTTEWSRNLQIRLRACHLCRSSQTPPFAPPATPPSLASGQPCPWPSRTEQHRAFVR